MDDIKSLESVCSPKQLCYNILFHNVGKWGGFLQQWSYHQLTISIVSADNLASWSIGGYKTLSSTRRKCHFCMATAEEIQSKVHFIYIHDNKLYF